MLHNSPGGFKFISPIVVNGHADTLTLSSSGSSGNQNINPQLSRRVSPSRGVGRGTEKQLTPNSSSGISSSRNSSSLLSSDLTPSSSSEGRNSSGELSQTVTSSGQLLMTTARGLSYTLVGEPNTDIRSAPSTANSSQGFSSRYGSPARDTRVRLNFDTPQSDGQPIEQLDVSGISRNISEMVLFSTEKGLDTVIEIDAIDSVSTVRNGSKGGSVPSTSRGTEEHIKWRAPEELALALQREPSKIERVYSGRMRPHSAITFSDMKPRPAPKAPPKVPDRPPSSASRTSQNRFRALHISPLSTKDRGTLTKRDRKPRAPQRDAWDSSTKVEKDTRHTRGTGWDTVGNKHSSRRFKPKAPHAYSSGYPNRRPREKAKTRALVAGAISPEQENRLIRFQRDQEEITQLRKQTKARRGHDPATSNMEFRLKVGCPDIHKKDHSPGLPARRLKTPNLLPSSGFRSRHYRGIK